jgi:hypothetical protein
MIELYRIEVSPFAPKIEFEDNIGNTEQLARWWGDYKEPLSPDRPFALKKSNNYQWNTFFQVARGALAVPSEICNLCEDMYYSLSAGGSELLSARDSEGKFFIVINPTSVFPNDFAEGRPLDITRYYATLFRIGGYPSDQIFCVSGSPLSGDDFKRVYEANGFEGLQFERIWSDSIRIT